MLLRKITTLLFVLALTVVSASAQTISTQRGDSRSRGVARGNSGSISNSERDKMIGSALEINSESVNYKKYNDTYMKDLEKRMEERDWSSEGTAWERARKTDTRDAYKRYIAIYPNGQHRPDANQRLIDLEVEDIFSQAHNNLPEMTKVEEDENCPTTTIVVENATDQPLTVMYSGTESKTQIITPRGRSSVTLKNGAYRIGAFVPDRNVKPFAGIQSLKGGRYETGYMIVTIYR